jgi:Thymidylate synthase
MVEPRMNYRYPNFSLATKKASDLLRDYSYSVHPHHWQGIDVATRPEAEMREILNHSFQVSLGWCEDLDVWRRDIGPNLPWADLHFEEERVSGEPINPGETWKIWPYGHSADKFRDATGQYNHSYAERYWPRFAGSWLDDGSYGDGHHGIRYRYADLKDLVEQLVQDPLTRQAYLPVWFPEDGSHHDRKPCTLGYHFIMRNNNLNCTYYIRSCDFMRHFRDDIYLTLRLQLWILDRLREADAETWNRVHVGMFTMHIVSLHIFINDYIKLFGRKP